MSVFTDLLLPTTLVEHSYNGRHPSSHLGAQGNFQDGRRVVTVLRKRELEHCLGA